MSFEDTERWLAFEPEVYSDGVTLNEDYGLVAGDGTERFKTVIAGWDDTAKTRKRGGWYAPGDPSNTIAPTVLNDGRIAIYGLWSEALVAALGTGEEQVDAEELTAEQVDELREEGA